MGEAQAWQPNYDESQVPDYELPDPLIRLDGTPVSDASAWPSRRTEIMNLFEESVYGRIPGGRPAGMHFEILEESLRALGGKATRRQVRVYFGEGEDVPHMDILLYIPSQCKRPVPGFLTLNFRGNHSIHADPAILLSEQWMPDDEKCAIEDHRATEASRGCRSSRWSVERILQRGYALATIYYGDLDPDFDDGFQNGVHPLFYQDGQTRPGSDQWGSIGAWAWGLHRAMDYLARDNDIDQRRIAVMGHSRLGKAALWAGATDDRFALVISNNSGCGGAALSRRCFGETVWRINKSFPHWFCDNFKAFNNRESELPVDQHMLIALIAPRPVYIASAHGDKWADPKGEFLSAKHASPVYKLLGLNGLPAQELPAVNRPSVGTVGYHIRFGGHDVTEFDWERYMEFMDRHLRVRKD